MQPFKDYLKTTPGAKLQKAVKEGPNPKDELTILQSPEHAYLYARNVLKQRWPEAEPTIKRDPNFWDRYQRELVYQLPDGSPFEGELPK